MAIDFPLFDKDHLLGESAMRPIAPRLTRGVAKNGPLRSICSRRSLSPTGS